MDIQKDSVDWNEVVEPLSKVECCQKVIKSNNEFEDVILFVSKEVSPRSIIRALDAYIEVSSDTDIDFSFLILTEEELSYWNKNAQEILYQR